MRVTTARAASTGLDRTQCAWARRARVLVGAVVVVAAAGVVTGPLPRVVADVRLVASAEAKPAGKARTGSKRTSRKIAAKSVPANPRGVRAAARVSPPAPHPRREPAAPAPADPATPVVSLPAAAPAKLPPIADMKAAVLAAPADEIRRVGRHLIVGYHHAGQLTPLLERGAIGGVFVTARNARGRTKDKITAEIATFRDLAAKAGQQPFWISTDQEGGGVSRLSPPLPHQPSLARLIADLKTPEARDTAVTAYADRQADALAAIGVNLNFAPVADLNLDARHARDQFTRLRHRAVSADPGIVTEVAGTYCSRLIERAISCTLKHFPGIGRVIADTHVTPATLKTPRDVLADADWLPFRHVTAKTPAFVMVGHPHLASVDQEVRPASTSRQVIDGIVRRELGFAGVVVTDDLAMGAIKRRPGGMPRAAVEAMAAGADLVLLGLDGDQIYAVLYAMLEAQRSGEVAAERWTESAARLAKAAETAEAAAASARVSRQAAAMQAEGSGAMPAANASGRRTDSPPLPVAKPARQAVSEGMPPEPAPKPNRTAAKSKPARTVRQ